MCILTALYKMKLSYCNWIFLLAYLVPDDNITPAYDYQILISYSLFYPVKQAKKTKLAGLAGFKQKNDACFHAASHLSVQMKF